MGLAVVGVVWGAAHTPGVLAMAHELGFFFFSLSQPMPRKARRVHQLPCVLCVALPRQQHAPL